MKIFIILLILIIALQFIHSGEYYILTVRNYLSNYSDIYFPYIDLYVKSEYDSTKSVSFYAGLTKLKPVNFYLSLDSLVFSQNNKHKLLIGDKSYLIPDFVNIRGLFYENSFSHITNGFYTGVNKDISNEDFPTFQHNKYITTFYSKTNITNVDTTGIFFSARRDDEEYNPYFLKKYFGIYHTSTIGRILNISLQYTNNRSYTKSNSILNKNRFNYNGTLRWRFMSLGIRGEYVPPEFINIGNIYYTRGRFYNIFSSSFKITDELSIYTLYQYMKFNPSDSMSYDRIGTKINMKIPLIARIGVSLDYSKYIIDRSGEKDFYWGIDIFRSIKAFVFNFVYTNSSNEFINRQNYLLTTAYTFPNASHFNLSAEYTNINNLWNYKYTGAIKWTPVKNWDIEFGTDIGERYTEKYFAEHLFNSYNTENFSISGNLSMRFFETRTYINFATNITIKNNISDYHLAIIKGRVFFDKNKNGKYDKGEPPVAGIYVKLNDSIKVKTNTKGEYSLRFLQPGKYSLDIDKGKLPAYFDVGKKFTVKLKNLKRVNVDIPLLKNGSVTGYVFYDFNKNGVKDENEPGIPNIIVKVKDSQNYTYTDRNGYYIIANLKPGNYIIEIPSLPKGYIFSLPNLINYVVIDKIKQDYTVDFGLLKESKPIRKKKF